MATYQMLWDCTQCGTKKLLGLDHRFCPACGAPQDPEARYFPSDDEKVAVEDHVYAGADRTCANCATANAAKAAFCVGCGAPMEGGAEVAKRERTLAGEADSAAEAKKEHRDRKLGAEKARPPEPPKKGGGGVGFAVVALVVGAFALLCCGGIWALTRTTSVEVVVAGHQWERSIAIETLQEVRESGWDEEVPADARERRCEQKQRGSEQVEDGQTCRTERVDQGDGTFSEEEKCTPKYRSEPTYDLHCTWVVERWKTSRTVDTEGGLGDEPRWPDVDLRGGERAGAKQSSEQVRFEGPDGDARSCEIPVSEWPSMPVGSAWTVEASVVTGGLDCDTLKAK